MKRRQYNCEGCGRRFEVPPMAKVKAGDCVCPGCAFDAELVRASCGITAGMILWYTVGKGVFTSFAQQQPLPTTNKIP